MYGLFWCCLFFFPKQGTLKGGGNSLCNRGCAKFDPFRCVVAIIVLKIFRQTCCHPSANPPFACRRATTLRKTRSLTGSRRSALPSSTATIARSFTAISRHERVGFPRLGSRGERMENMCRGNWLGGGFSLLPLCGGGCEAAHGRLLNFAPLFV